MKHRIILTTAASLIFTAASTGAAGDSTDEARLISALSADNIGWRVSAAQVLGERQVEAAVEPLIRVLMEDKEYAARFTAAVALLRIGDAQSLPALKRAAQHDRSKTVRHIAAVAYSELRKASELAASNKWDQAGGPAI